MHNSVECQYIQSHICGMDRLDHQTQCCLGICPHINSYCSYRMWESVKPNTLLHMFDWLVHLHTNHMLHDCSWTHITLSECSQTLKDCLDIYLHKLFDPNLQTQLSKKNGIVWSNSKQLNHKLYNWQHTYSHGCQQSNHQGNWKNWLSM